MTNEIKTACNSDLTGESVSVRYEGKIIHFCEQECLDEFNLDPEKFIESNHFLIEFQLLPLLKSE